MTTIINPVKFSGKGIHSGIYSEVILHPSYQKKGINFVRTDVSPRLSVVPARLENVGSFPRCTSVVNDRGVSVLTIEHLMAAIYMMEIHDLTIEISGPEVPAMDGGALEFIHLLRKAGKSDLFINNDNTIFITSPICVEKGDARVEFVPFPAFSLLVSVSYPEKNKLSQKYFTKNLTMEIFEKELAGEKTYAFDDEIMEIISRGLGQGGDESNTRIIFPETESGNGMARHKALDAVGDIALIGKRIVGQFRSFRGGHELNHALLREVVNQNKMSNRRPEPSTARTPFE